MSERSEFDDQANDLIERYLLFLRGQGPEPDLGHLTSSQRRAMRARLEIIDALADRDPVLPALEDDPVAMRLGLVSDRGPGGGDTPAPRHEQGGGDGEAPDPASGLLAAPIRGVLDELESAFGGQVVVEWAPSWGGWRTPDLEPLAQCAVLGDVMAVFVTDQVDSPEEPLALASFLRRYPDVSAVGLVTRDASQAVMLTAATCNRAIDPVRGWLEPGTYVATDSFVLTLRQYFEQRLPRWERVAGLSELLELGDVVADARRVVADEIESSLRIRPRLEHKRQAQQALRDVDPSALSTLVVAVHAGTVTVAEMADRVLGMVEAPS